MVQTLGEPDLLSARRLLCVQPHYDDNDIVAGGTLALLHDRGAEVTYLTVTDDLVGIVDPHLPDEQALAQLKREQAAAGELIGVDRHIWLGFPDAGPLDYYNIRWQIIRQIRLLHPDFLVTCDPWLPYEAHRDHIMTGMAVAEASFLQSMPRFKTEAEVDRDYQPYALSGVAFYASQRPNTTIDISTTWERKRRAVACYQAQFTEEDMRRLLDQVEAEERVCAKGKTFSHAETFKLLRPDQLHLDTHTWQL